VMLPTPPASATATASAGVDTEPIGACWIGTWQPANSVKRVVIAMITTLRRARGHDGGGLSAVTRACYALAAGAVAAFAGFWRRGRAGMSVQAHMPASAITRAR